LFEKRRSAIWSLVVAVVLGTVFICSGTGSVQAAEKWPNKPISIVVPFSAGGSAGRLAHIVAPFLTEALGVPVSVKAKPGGAGIVGTTAHLKNDPTDGSTIIFQLQPYLTGAVFKGAKFKISDFAFISNFFTAPESVWVRNDSPYMTIKELLTGIKEKELTYAYLNNSFTLVGAKMIEGVAGGKATGIPYQGGGNQLMALIGGHVDFVVSNHYSAYTKLAEKGRGLAIFSDNRNELAPEIPTINEALAKMGINKGLPDISNLYFVMVKKAVKEKHPERFNILAGAFENILKKPELIALMKKQNWPVQWMPPEEITKKVMDSNQVLQGYKSYWKKKKK
jgi:putative tricarboxylic transport membrane protein